jgi:hypothetical protein
MKKTFEDNYNPIEIDIKNNKGELFELKSNMITLDEIDKISDIEKDKELKKNPALQVIRIMQIVFGKDEKFWKQFSVNLLTKLSVHTTEEIKKNNNTVED